VTTASKVKTVSPQTKLQRLTAEVHALRQQLRTAHRLATVGTMAAMVSHELNNILTPIMNYAQMAQKNPSFSDKAIARAVEGGQRATHICRAILNLTADGAMDPSPVNLRALVDQTLEAMARDPAKDNIGLNLDIPTDLTVRACRPELQQVLLNLLVNARSAVLAKSGPRQIDVSARCENSGTLIAVADNGVGIDPQHLDKLFEPFFTTKRRSEDGSGGYGLGLAFCRHVVEGMGGEILVESTPGQGATFTVRLPA
jgi:signal transduction histidine kinase